MFLLLGRKRGPMVDESPAMAQVSGGMNQN
jgi:hypothetical protein